MLVIMKFPQIYIVFVSLCLIKANKNDCNNSFSSVFNEL